jgi:hypothetical protein
MSRGEHYNYNMEFRNTCLSWTSSVQHENARVLRTNQKVDSSGRKIGSQALSLKLQVQSGGKTSKMATLHPAEGIGGDAFVGGGVSRLLVGDGALSTVGFGRLFWRPIKKTKTGSVEVSITTTTWKPLAFVGCLLCRTGTRGCYQPDRK